MRRVLFWSSAALIAYVYALFPMLVVARGLLFRRPVRAADIEPEVSLLIAARNEAAALPSKLANLAALDYPRERLEIIVASDGSTDATNELVTEDARRPGSSVRLLSLPAGGKAAALNAAAAIARGEVLVFSDANSLFRADAIRRLVRPLADPDVGGVAGNQVYSLEGITGEAAGERGYWRLDTLLKEFESRAGNAIGGTGAIYAIRRSLFRPIPAGVNDDFYLTAGVIDQGQRLVFAPDAAAYETPAGVIETEYARKVRVVSRAMRCVLAMPGLLDVRAHRFYAVQLWSHKVLRWLMAIPLAVQLVASASLARSGRLTAFAFLAQSALYGAAFLGTVAPRLRAAAGPVLAVPTYFVMVNAAAMRALWNVVTGRSITTWNPAERLRSSKRKPEHEPTRTPTPDELPAAAA